MPTVLTAKGNGIRWALEAHAAELALWSKKDCKAAIKGSITVGGNVFLEVFIPLRFNPSYAYKLGYYVGTRWRKEKQKYLGKALPWIGYTPAGGHGHNREKMAVAVTKSRVQVPATLDACLLIIPIGHGIQTKDTIAFHKVLPAEIERVAEKIHQTLEGLLAANPERGDGGRDSSGRFQSRPPIVVPGAEQSRIAPPRQKKGGPARQRNVGPTRQRKGGSDYESDRAARLTAWGGRAA